MRTVQLKKASFEARMIWLVLLAIFIIRLLILTKFGLFPDEAYYWDWHRFLSFGYFDHPPMIAWLVHLTTAVLGDTYWGVKAVPLLLSLGVSIAAYFLAKYYLESFSSRMLLLLLLNVTLLYAVGGLLLTPDIPAIFFWALALLFGYMAVFEKKTFAWPLLGLVAGLGLLSKYVFVLFIGAFALFLLFDMQNRRLLLSWRPWLALLVALLIFLPNIIWNSAHNWASYSFQLGHGLRNGGWPRLNYFFEYLGGEMAMFSPFMFVVLVMAVVWSRRAHHRDSRLLYLSLFLFVPLAFFAGVSLGAHVEVNWPAPAFLSGLVLVMWFWERMVGRRRMRLFLAFAMAFSSVTTILIIGHSLSPFVPLDVRRDRTFDPKGWAAMARQIDAQRSEHDPAGTMPLCTINYQTAALTAFYCQDQPRTWALNLRSRRNHYTFIEDRLVSVQDTLLFIIKKSDSDNNGYEDYFESSEKLTPVLRRLTPACADTFVLNKVTLNSKALSEMRDEAVMLAGAGHGPKKKEIGLLEITNKAKDKRKGSIFHFRLWLNSRGGGVEMPLLLLSLRGCDSNTSANQILWDNGEDLTEKQGNS